MEWRSSLTCAALLGAAAVLLTACASSVSRPPSSPVVAAPRSSVSSVPGTASAVHRAGLPAFDHVVVVVFENKGADAVTPGAAPFLDRLASGGAAFTDAHGVTHPSQPNYLDLFSGSDQGVTDDSCGHTFTAPNLASQLIAARRTFVGYSEDLPAPGSTACAAPSATSPVASGYARKHNPWSDFSNVPATANQPFTAFPADYATLPTVSVVVPNLCHDMHDCPVGAGDTWLAQHLASYADWARSHDSLLIVTFDEDEGTATNHIPTVLFGAHVRSGSYPERIDHFSVLRTLEDLYGLPPLAGAANARAVTGVWS